MHYLPQRSYVQSLMDQALTSEHSQHELMQPHAFVPDIHALEATAHVLALPQLLLLQSQLRLPLVVAGEVLDRHRYQQRCEGHVEYQKHARAFVVFVWENVSISYCLCVYVCMYMCMYVCMYVCIL